MAKMFYTLDEVCEKLGKSEDEIKEMARTGQIQEFRDREKLMFKVDQIDLLAGGDDESTDVHLDLEDTSGGSGLDLQTDSALGLEESRLGLEESATGSGLDLEETGAGGGSGLGMESSGSGLGAGLGLEESREGTGISVFDTGHGEAEASGERTRPGDVTSGDEEDELSLESVGSGSGLLDLTRESDDTSLGAELLEEVYSGDENIEIPGSASGLFGAVQDDTAAEEPVAVGAEMASVPMVITSYDGSGSGLGVGLMIGAMVALVVVGIVIAAGLFGTTSDLALKLSGSANTVMIVGGGLLGATIILGLVGWFIGKATE